MQTSTVLTGLACGVMLTITGLSLLDQVRSKSRLSGATRILVWLTGALLLLGAAAATATSGALAPASRLIAMAALGTPIGIGGATSGDRAIRIVPSLVLAGIGLFSPLVDAGTAPAVAAWAMLAVIVGGGLGARALGEALCELARPTPHTGRPLAASALALLVPLSGALALVNLDQRGVMWTMDGRERGLAAALLIWLAAWVNPYRHRRLQAVLVALGALLLIALALV